MYPISAFGKKQLLPFKKANMLNVIRALESRSMPGKLFQKSNRMSRTSEIEAEHGQEMPGPGTYKTFEGDAIDKLLGHVRSSTSVGLGLKGSSSSCSSRL